MKLRVIMDQGSALAPGPSLDIVDLAGLERVEIASPEWKIDEHRTVRWRRPFARALGVMPGLWYSRCVDSPLIREGLMNDIGWAINRARKEAGMKMTDRIPRCVIVGEHPFPAIVLLSWTALAARCLIDDVDYELPDLKA